jgi:hypothetical protein
MGKEKGKKIKMEIKVKIKNRIKRLMDVKGYRYKNKKN